VRFLVDQDVYFMTVQVLKECGHDVRPSMVTRPR